MDKKGYVLLLLLATSILLESHITAAQNTAPVLTVPSGVLGTVSEDSPVGTSIYQCVATDVDDPNTDDGTLRYYIDPPVDGLVVDAATCEFYVVPGLDYETATTVTGTLSAEDKSGLKDTASFTFDISDANDNYPRCTYLTIVGELVENTASAGDTIGTFACTDADEAGSVNVDLLYQIDPITPTNAIEINSVTGEATIKRTLDYEVDGPTLSVTVHIYDQGTPDLTTTGTIVLHITDLDDNIPTFDLAPFTAAEEENVTVGTVLMTVNLTDLDQAGTANSEVTVLLTSPCTPDVILLDSKTGDLILKSSLDYETATTVTCDLYAYSSTMTTDTSTATFTLTVEDVNDNTPIFGQTYYSTSVAENSVAGTQVMQFTATDQDSGDLGSVNYTLTDATGTFTIDPLTGMLEVVTAPDYETATAYLLVVSAEDNGSPALTSSVFVQVLIEPVNEFTPSITNAGSIPSFSEDVALGTSIYAIAVSDNDGGEDGEISYTMVTTGVPFFVDSAGIIRVTSGVDYETQTSYEFVIEAADNSATSPLSSTATFTATIDDADDNPLTCDSVSTLSLAGPASSYLSIVQATITCTDPDTTSGALSYSITGGNTDSAWAISAGGQVTITAEPTQTQYDLVIQVDDSGSGDSVNVEFTVFAETTLAFPGGMITDMTIDENTSGTYQLNLSACCVFGEVEYSIIAGNTDSKAAFASSAGQQLYILPYDRETTALYEYVFQAVSDGGQTATVTFTVTVADENDNAPVYAQNVYNIDVAETMSPATIGFYTATDADEGINAALTYAIISGNGAGKFSLDSTTGALNLAATLDYETTESYTLVLEAVDGGSPTALTGSTTVVVSVTNTDDSAVTIIPLPGSYSETLSEDVPLGKSVFDVNATDPDTDSFITFAIESGNTDSDFGIDPDTGYIYVAHFLDRERTASYSLTLTAVDNLFLTTATGTLDITISDVNDNDPTFAPSVFEFDVDDAAPSGTSVGVIAVTDDDDGANAALTTTIIAGDTSTFQLNGLDLETLGIIDYVTVSQYRLTIQSVDSGSPARTATTAVVVNVLPQFDQPNFGPTISDTVSLNEDTEVGQELYDLDATYYGAIEGDGSTLYSIQSGNTGSAFGVRQQTGEVYLASTLDYETTTSYTLVIQAQNSPTTGNTDTFTLTVDVGNINEHDPIFDENTVNGQNSFSFEVDESAIVGDVVGSVSASDADSGSPGDVTHTLSGSSDFAIDPTTGSITVAAVLDYTVTNVYNLIATATDGGSTARSESVSVVIRVVDTNNNAPVFTSATTAQVLDSAPVGSEFFHVLATDADTGDAGTIQYSFVSDTSLGKIVLDADTGVLSVGGQLDSALASSYVFSVKATDQGVPSQETTSSLTVNIISTVPNYYDPVFTTDPVSAIVSRSASAATTVVSVAATDADSGESGDLVYKILSGNDDGLFLIDRATGIISTAASVLGAEDSYSLVVEACDGGVPSRFANVTVDITVSPSQTSSITPDYIFTIAEDENVGFLVGEVLQDAGRTASSYTIDSGNIGTTFNIALNGGTGRGQITTLEALDYETIQTYSLLISATTDIGDFPKVVEVQVTDVNDNPPTFASNSLTLTLDENMPVGYTVTTITLTDADTAAANTDNSLSLTNPGPNLFNIEQTGALVIATPPDYETVGSQTIFDVVAVDQQSPFTSATVTVTVNIVDVIEEEERRHSPITSNAQISLGCHFPATDGDIIHLLSPGDFGVEENASATVEYDSFSRNYPFSLSSDGYLSVSDAASLNYPEKYYHWAVIRSTNAGVTTARASLLRIDTYSRDTHMAVFEFNEDVETVRANLETLLFRTESYLPANQRLGISLLIDTSTTTARRRLLATQTAAYVYVLSDTSQDNMENINAERTFLTVDEILAVFQLYTDGTVTPGLSSGAQGLSLGTVEPFDDSTDNSEFATSTAGIALWALLGLFLILVGVGIWFCFWWRKDEDYDPDDNWKSERSKKKKKNKADRKISHFLTTSSTSSMSRPGSAPDSTDLPKQRPWYTSIDESYQRFLANKENNTTGSNGTKTITFANSVTDTETGGALRSRPISVATPNPDTPKARSVSVANPETAKTRSVSVPSPERRSRAISVANPPKTRSVSVSPDKTKSRTVSVAAGSEVKARSKSVAASPVRAKSKARRVGVVDMSDKKARSVSVAKMESPPKSSVAANDADNVKARSVSVAFMENGQLALHKPGKKNSN